MTRAISLNGRAFVSAPRDDGRRYTVAEAVDVLAEQGWMVVPRRDEPYLKPRLVAEPYVLARLETLCGCTRDVFTPVDQHRPYYRVPIASQDLVRNWMSVDAANEVAFRAREFRFESYERGPGGVRIAHYRERP